MYFEAVSPLRGKSSENNFVHWPPLDKQIRTVRLGVGGVGGRKSRMGSETRRREKEEEEEEEE